MKRVAKSEKKAAVQPGSGRAASGKSSGAETPPGKDEAGNKNTLFIIGACAGYLPHRQQGSHLLFFAFIFQGRQREKKI